jgi:hypothetical protein
MIRTKKSTVAKKLARQIKLGHQLGTNGTSLGTALWAGGSGILLQQMYTGSQNKVLPAVGAAGALIGAPLMQMSKPLAKKYREGNFLRLVGKRRLALATAQRLSDPGLKGILLLIASAKTEKEKEAVKKMIQNGVTQDIAKELVSASRRAIELEDSHITRKFFKSIRSLRGIEARKLDFIAKRIAEELIQNKINGTTEYQERIQSYIAPYGLSHAIDIFKITDNTFGKKFFKLAKEQRARFVQKLRLKGELNLAEAGQDIVIHQTGSEMHKLLVEQLGTSRNASAFINYFEHVNTQLSEYVQSRIVEEVMKYRIRSLFFNHLQ